MAKAEEKAKAKAKAKRKAIASATPRPNFCAVLAGGIKQITKDLATDQRKTNAQQKLIQQLQRRNANPRSSSRRRTGWRRCNSKTTTTRTSLRPSRTNSRPSAPDTGRFGLGLEGDDGGGEIVTAGTPERIATTKGSYTGQFLKPVRARGAASRGKKRVEAAE